MQDISTELTREQQFSRDSSSAWAGLDTEIAAYVDRPRSLLFMEDGIVRFENTNVVVHARAEGEASREHMGPLSITFARGGRRVCRVDGRRMALDDDSYLVTNLGQSVSGTPERDSNSEMFLVGFWPGFAEEILRSCSTPADRLLDDAKLARFQPVEFFPQLYRNDELVSPVLQQLECAIHCGGMTRGWLEECNHLLLQRLLLVHRRIGRDIEALPAIKASKIGRASCRERV